MELSFLYIMTFYFWLIQSSEIAKRHVYNSIEPLPENVPIYNLTNWVKHLHLQQCVIVEVGETFCAVFVEHKNYDQLNSSAVEEYFLGLCDSETLRKWRYCPFQLEEERPKECTFQQNTEFSKSPSRVHRRLCDISTLSLAKSCDCSREFAGQNLLEVTGFPTCFISPLPQSICLPRNVCGMFSCNASTINQKIHSVKCSSHCLYGQPFCEHINQESSKASEIRSFWTDWREPPNYNNQIQQIILSEAICINKNTGLGAIDCLGPGTNCCPPDLADCSCHTYIEDGVMKLARQFRLVPISLTKRQMRENILRQKRSIIGKLAQIFSNGVVKRFEKDEEYEDDDDPDNEDDEDIVLEENNDESDEDERSDNEVTMPQEIITEGSESPDKKKGSSAECTSAGFWPSVCIGFLTLLKGLITYKGCNLINLFTKHLQMR